MLPLRVPTDRPEPDSLHSEPTEVASHQWRCEMKTQEQQERWEYHRLRLKVAEELLLTRVEAGETEAIQSLLLLVSEAIRDGCPLTDKVADFISRALANIHGGMNGNDAFGIKRKPGEKDTRASRGRAYSMADCVERLMHHNGLTLELAIAAVAQRFSVSPDTVKGGWMKNYKEVRRTFELEKQTLGAIDIVRWPG